MNQVIQVTVLNFGFFMSVEGNWKGGIILDSSLKPGWINKREHEVL